MQYKLFSRFIMIVCCLRTVCDITVVRTEHRQLVPAAAVTPVVTDGT